MEEKSWRETEGTIVTDPHKGVGVICSLFVVEPSDGDDGRSYHVNYLRKCECWTHFPYPPCSDCSTCSPSLKPLSSVFPHIEDIVKALEKFNETES